MRGRTLMLALVMLPTTVAPGWAGSCQSGDLAKQIAALPGFIVVQKDEQPRQSLSRVLGCDLPPPELPTLADGQAVQPKLMVGKNVLDTHGESVGVIKDVVIDPQSRAVNSVVTLLPKLGSADVAVPVGHFALAEGQFSLRNDSTTRLMTLTPFHFDSSSVSIANPTTTSWASSFSGLWNLLRPQYGEIPIRVDSEPQGATLFVREQNQGTTEIHGLLRAADMAGLRLELKGYRPCRFVDGTFADPTPADADYATFRCKLTAAP